MSDNIIAIQDDGRYNFDAAKLVFREPKSGANGGKIINMMYDGSPLMLELPEMTAPFGVQDGFGEQADSASKKKKELQLAMDDLDRPERSDMREAQRVLEEIDEVVCATALKRSQVWLRKPHKSLEAVSSTYKTIQRKHEEGKYAPKIKVALGYTPEGEPRFLTYDASQRKVDDIRTIDARQAKVTAIVTLSGVWVTGAGFGVMVRATQLLVKPKATMPNCAFRNLRLGDATPPPTTTTGLLAPRDPDLLESSDDDAEVAAPDDY